jgi:hypothetical protein
LLLVRRGKAVGRVLRSVVGRRVVALLESLLRGVRRLLAVLLGRVGLLLGLLGLLLRLWMNKVRWEREGRVED